MDKTMRTGPDHLVRAGSSLPHASPWRPQALFPRADRGSVIEGEPGVSVWAAHGSRSWGKGGCRLSQPPGCSRAWPASPVVKRSAMLTRSFLGGRT